MAEPFLKWPGGKRWLVKRYGDIFPSGYRRYVEPFLGAAAVFFHLSPRVSLLSDENPELVNLYTCLKENASCVDAHLQRLQQRHNAKLYYDIRAARPSSSLDRAVRFLYLNRACFNGIYRVNLRGEFNVPIGSKTQIAFPPGTLNGIALQLKRAVIKQADFETTIQKAAEGDFVYIDPPYTVAHNFNNFVKYNATLFSWSDQERLARAARAASGRGAKIMVSNADHRSVRALYEGFGYSYRISRSSILAANANFRRSTTELLVTNYPVSSLTPHVIDDSALDVLSDETHEPSARAGS